jgi:hypothetical protein
MRWHLPITTTSYGRSAIGRTINMVMFQQMSVKKCAKVTIPRQSRGLSIEATQWGLIAIDLGRLREQCQQKCLAMLMDRWSYRF